jgi:hypothetical protein
MTLTLKGKKRLAETIREEGEKQSARNRGALAHFRASGQGGCCHAAEPPGVDSLGWLT